MSTRAVAMLAAGGMGFLIATTLVQVRSPNDTSRDGALDASSVASNRQNEGLSNVFRSSSSRPQAVVRYTATIEQQEQSVQAELSGENRFDEPLRLDELQKPGSGKPILLVRKNEAEFAAQSKDPSWSEFTEARILADISLASAGFGYSAILVDCRTTLCRVELIHPTAPALGPVEQTGEPSPGQPSLFLVAQTLGMEPQLVLAARDGYGTPITLAFLRRGHDTARTE